MQPRQKRTRGYPVALLIGLEDDAAYIWQVFSRAIKPMTSVHLCTDRGDQKALYNFYESVINKMRQIIREGVRSIIISSQPKNNYFQELINHIDRHHAWLKQGENKIMVTAIAGSAATHSQVAQLAKSSAFREIVKETASEEAGDLIDLLEKHLNTSNEANVILFSIDETEDAVLRLPRTGIRKTEYLILTDKYLNGSKQKNRLNRLFQIATNKGVKTRVIESESPAGQRIAQLGGIVYITRKE